MPASLVVKWTAQRKMLEENLRISERLNRRKEENGDRCILSKTARSGRYSPTGHREAATRSLLTWPLDVHSSFKWSFLSIPW